MRIYITLTLIFISTVIFSQIPFSIFEFDEVEQPISHLDIGDLGNRGLDNIYFITENADEITRIFNFGDGETFQQFKYIDAPNVNYLNILSLNGGDDLAITSEGAQGISTFYGKDPFLSEKSKGDVILKEKDISVLDIENQVLGGFGLCVILDNDKSTLHFVQLMYGSFNMFSTQYFNNYQYGPGLESISAISDRDSASYFITNSAAGSLSLIKAYTIDFFDVEIRDAKIIDDDLGAPTYSTVYSDSLTSDLFVIDKSRGTIYKYDLSNESFDRTEIVTGFENPSYLEFGNLDKDGKPDLIVVDENAVWMVSNVFERSNQLEKELLFENDKNIKILRSSDFNADGYTDIILLGEEENNIKLLTNEILTSNDKITINELIVFPNPSNGIFNFSKEVKQASIIDLQGQILKLNIQNQVADLTHLPQGAYILKTTLVNDQISVNKIEIFK